MLFVSYRFPEDEKTYAIDELFLWGQSILIAQVLYPVIYFFVHFLKQYKIT